MQKNLKHIIDEFGCPDVLIDSGGDIDEDEIFIDLDKLLEDTVVGENYSLKFTHEKNLSNK